MNRFIFHIVQSTIWIFVNNVRLHRPLVRFAREQWPHFQLFQNFRHMIIYHSSSVVHSHRQKRWCHLLLTGGLETPGQFLSRLPSKVPVLTETRAYMWIHLNKCVCETHSVRRDPKSCLVRRVVDKWNDSQDVKTSQSKGYVVLWFYSTKTYP